MVFSKKNGKDFVLSCFLQKSMKKSENLFEKGVDKAKNRCYYHQARFGTALKGREGRAANLENDPEK